MHDYICPEKVLTALRWLKQNNPLYADIDINEEWLEQALADDQDLFAGLVQQKDTLYSGASNLNSENTKQPANENSIDNGGSSSNQPVNKDGTECCCSSSDALAVAFNVLERVARENEFAIHNVPYDGDCSAA